MKLAATATRTRGPLGLCLPLVVFGLLLAGLEVSVQAQAVPAQAGRQAIQQAQKAAAKPAPAAPQRAAAASAAAEAPRTGLKRRDPFRSLLVSAAEMPGGQALPPGKAGLVIAQLTITGVVAAGKEMIAVVNMTGRNRAYFLRQGDELFNGYVGEISEDGVVFKERTMDAFGKEYERDVVKQLTGTGKPGPGAKR